MHVWRSVRAWSFLFFVPLLAGCAIQRCFNTCPPLHEHHTKSCTVPTMMNLASDLDNLEQHLERYGSITAAQPSVWGQARLMQHREEFEEQMKGELGKFTETLQGSILRTDQAYLASAFSLSAAISGPAAFSYMPRESASVLDAKRLSLDQAVDPSKLVGAEASKGIIERTELQSFAGPKFTQVGLKLEPTLLLDQKKRYLDHLHALRRINEGDDTADSPGYALNLVRVPVSVLPGHKTREGYAAEITATIQPILSENLLPDTFRNLVMNDLVDQISVPLVMFLNDEQNIKDYMEKHEITHLAIMGEWEKIKALAETTEKKGLHKDVDKVNGHGKDKGGATEKVGFPLNGKPSREDLRRFEFGENFYDLTDAKGVEKLKRDFGAQVKRIPPPVVSYGKGRKARLPFPPTQLYDVYGYDALFHIAYATYHGFHRNSHPALRYHLPDVQGFLREEFEAAFEFLSTEQNQHLWAFCNSGLAQSIRAGQFDVVADQRERFFNTIVQQYQRISITRNGKPVNSEDAEEGAFDEPRHRVLAALAWTIIVESALLNDHLIDDMSRTAQARGCGLPACKGMMLAGPNPPLEARMAFLEYVRCRWPIHVFALDPAADDQNIADAFSRRRETQLAISLAFASGQISARKMTNYMRRIEHDMATIAINRTAVGFAHGPDTFGWRFSPRLQTPEIEGNLTVLTRDLIIGGPNRDVEINQRRIEPGQRECVAIIVMPSFIPFAKVDFTSRWVKLTHPKATEPDLVNVMKLSQKVRTLQQCGSLVADQDCYRGGDYALLMRKLEQISTRLPLQSMQVQVPYENTLGGFEMFNTGVTDLAPELIGWYGAPGVNPKKNTTLFLVGRNFSTAHTHVIAGARGLPAANVKMLSREVIQVTIPKELEVDTVGTKVDIHVATPYGVTQHLLVPIVSEPAPKPAAVSGYKLITEKTRLEIKYEIVGGKVLFKNTEKSELRISWEDPTGLAGANVHVNIQVPTLDGKNMTATMMVKSGEKEIVIAGVELEALAAVMLDELAKHYATKPFPASIRVTAIGVQAESKGPIIGREVPVVGTFDIQLTNVTK